MQHGTFYQSIVKMEWDNKNLKRSSHVEITFKAEIESYDQNALTKYVPFYDRYFSTKNQETNVTFYP